MVSEKKCGYSVPVLPFLGIITGNFEGEEVPEAQFQIKIFYLKTSICIKI